jgi:hypothetical protein
MGSEYWTDGSQYTGNYVNSKKQGRGQYIWPDGNKYIGEWKDNTIDGQGLYIWHDGRMYFGDWQNNLMHGFGTYKWLDGRMYHGQYQNDKKHGFGVYVWADGRAYVGDWFEGKQADTRVYILPNGVTRRGIWENGSRKPWINLDKAEAAPYKEQLEEALKKGKEVDEIKRKFEQEFLNIGQSQIERTEQIHQQQLPDQEEIEYGFGKVRSQVNQNNEEVQFEDVSAVEDKKEDEPV